VTGPVYEPIPPGSPSPLGPFVGPPQVRGAVLRTLARWGPFYVAEAARQTGLELPGFNDWVNEPMESPETVGEAPRYVVAVPGTFGLPERHGNGMVRAAWDVQIACWMWGQHYQETQDRLTTYAVALRQLMIQQPSLGGFAEATTWRAERYAEVAAASYRTWGQANLQFAVTVREVVNAFAGPRDVPDDPTRPPVPDPPVTGTRIEVRAQPPA
jgi:hypothetical protein